MVDLPKPDPRVRTVFTGTHGQQLMTGCNLCGVLIWDVNLHYAHAHPDATNPTGSVGS